MVQRLSNIILKYEMKLQDEKIDEIIEMMIEFDYKLDYKKLDFTDKEVRKLYRIGRGEQGVLLVKPYTNDICKYWRFKTPTIAENQQNKYMKCMLITEQ